MALDTSNRGRYYEVRLKGQNIKVKCKKIVCYEYLA